MHGYWLYPGGANELEHGPCPPHKLDFVGDKAQAFWGVACNNGAVWHSRSVLIAPHAHGTEEPAMDITMHD